MRDLAANSQSQTEFKSSGKRESGKTEPEVMDNLKETMSFEHIRTDAHMRQEGV